MQKHLLPSRSRLKLVLALLYLCTLLPCPAAAQAATHRTHPLIVVLDPGHGGDESGAEDFGRVEKALTLRVALKAQIYLRKMGYRVYLTRTHDRPVNTPPRDLNHDGKVDAADEADARTLFANRHHGDVFISIHFDGSADPSIHGTHGYYCPDRPFWRKSVTLARSIVTSIARDLDRAHYRSPNLGVKTDVADIVPQQRSDYPWFLVLGPSHRHFVTGTAMPGALIETLYLSNPQDAATLGHSSIISAVAKGYADGIRAYFGNHGKQ